MISNLTLLRPLRQSQQQLLSPRHRRLPLAPHYYPGFQHHQQRWFEYIIDPKAISRQAAKDKSRKQTAGSASNKPSYRFVDRTRVRVAGGCGGKGSLSMESIRRKFKLRPDGGHGGNGGNVVLVADPNEQSLRWSHPHLQAEKGSNGSSQDCHGRNGENLIVRVPCGVVVKRVLDRRSDTLYDNDGESSDDMVHDNSSHDHAEQWEEIDLEKIDYNNDETIHEDDEDDDDDGGFPYTTNERETVVLADLDQPGSSILVARGGRGGLGSCVYAKDHGKRPDASVLIQNAKPEPGQVAFLELELKLIADVGLVGFPNAGKSSLLRAMSRAAPEVAPYPFTTLHPFLGCIDYRDGFRVKVADIPGLIDGAAEGRGKGHDFLRHIERTKALLYVVDIAGVDYRDPVEDLYVLANEIASYGDGSMLERRALVVANKIDLLYEERIKETCLALAQAAGDIGLHTADHDVIGISAGVTGDGLAVLSKAIRDVVTRTEEDRLVAFQQAEKSQRKNTLDEIA